VLRGAEDRLVGRAAKLATPNDRPRAAGARRLSPAARPNRGPRSDQPVAHLAQGRAQPPGDVHGGSRSRQGGVESIVFVVSRPGPGDEAALDVLAGPV
jgi:hypothetical protein